MINELIKIASAALTCGQHDESVGRPMLDEFENTFNPEMVLKMLKVIELATKLKEHSRECADDYNNLYGDIVNDFDKALKEMEHGS